MRYPLYRTVTITDLGRNERQHMNRRLTAVILCAVMLALAACGGKKEEKKETTAEAATVAAPVEVKKVEKYTPAVHEEGIYYVGIIQQADHEDLSLSSEGFRDRLSELMGEDVVVDYKVADGTAEDCDVIVDHFLQDKDDLIMACGTMALERAYAATKDVPIVGAAVTDFVIAGGVSSTNEPAGNVTGISDLPPMQSQAEYLLGVADGSRIGIVYCTGELNSGFQVKVLEKYLDDEGAEYEEYAFSDDKDIEAAITKACDECGTIFLPTDNMLARNMAAVKRISLEKGTKVFASTESMCKAGALAAYGIDYYELGCRTAHVACDIMTYYVDKAGDYADDEETRDSWYPGEVPIDRVRDTAGGYYNPVIAEKLGWTSNGSFSEVEVETEEEPAQENSGQDGTGKT